MRHKMMRGFLLMVFFVLFCPRIASTQEVSSEELINHALRYDGKEVIYTGELIEAVLKRGSSVCLNLSDGKNVIGVWASRDLALPVKVAGSYARSGDMIRVEGVFHRSCIEHGGGLDIHAVGITVVARGSATAHRLERHKIIILLVLLGVLACLLIVNLLSRNLSKR